MITGYFKSISIPEVPVGQDIKATINFSALNPGALYWKTFLIVDSPGLNLKKELDAARELGQEGGRKKTYDLGKMPDKEVAISFFIFAHDDAGYDWSWSEYDGWIWGFATEVTHLDSEYKFISPGSPTEIIDFSLSQPTADPYRSPPGPVVITCPVTSLSNVNVTAQVACIVYEGSKWITHGTKLWQDYKTVTLAPGETKDVQFMRTSIAGTIDKRDVEVEVRVGGQLIVEKEWDDVFYVTAEEPPPGEGTFSGVITEVKPLTFEFGELVKLLVSFTAYARNWTAQILWETRLTATLDGLSGSDSQNHTGEGGSRDEQPLHLGAMPNRNLSGEIILEARVGWPYSWTELYRMPISVIVTGEPPGAECSIDADCPPGYICQGGICVPEDAGPPIACSIDADCPAGYTCQNGVCVKKKEEIPWTLIAAGALALAILLPGKQTKKKKKSPRK